MANIAANGNAINPFTPVLNAGKKFFEVGSYLVNNTDAFNKISKLALAIIGFITTILTQYVPGAAAALNLLSKIKIGPEAAVNITNATGIVERLFEFTDPRKFEDIKKTPQKLISRITLTAGQILDTVTVFDNLEVIDVSAFNPVAVGKLSTIVLIKNAFITISSIFSIWDAAKTIHGAPTTRAKAQAKLQKWTGMQPTAVQQYIQSKPAKYAAEADDNALQAHKQNKWTIKLRNCNNTLPKAWVSIAADIAKIAIIALSSIALIFLIATPLSMIAIGATGLVTATLGLLKPVLGEFVYKDQKDPINPLKLANA